VDLTPDDLADFADRYLDLPWAVYLQGLDQVLTCPCLCLPADGCGRAFDRESAVQLAQMVSRDATVGSALHGVQSVEITPHVLHHGIVWIEP